MKLWQRSYVYSRSADGTPRQRVDVQCYEQPFWAWLRGRVFHRTLCPLFGRWHWNLVRTGGWPDDRCFVLNELHRVTQVLRFETDEKVPVIGNDRRRRITTGIEDAIWEARYWVGNAARRGKRDAKRAVTRRERREGRQEARDG